jgi:hypothetical protein
MRKHEPQGTPTHAWLLDPLSGIVHLVRAKDAHPCCAPVWVKSKPSTSRWEVDRELNLQRRCGICQKWCEYYVSLQQRKDVLREMKRRN